MCRLPGILIFQGVHKTRKPFNLEIQAKLNGIFKLAFYTEETLYSNFNQSCFAPLFPGASSLVLYLIS